MHDIHQGEYLLSFSVFPVHCRTRLIENVAGDIVNCILLGNDNAPGDFIYRLLLVMLGSVYELDGLSFLISLVGEIDLYIQFHSMYLIFLLHTIATRLFEILNGLFHSFYPQLFSFRTISFTLFENLDGSMSGGWTPKMLHNVIFFLLRLQFVHDVRFLQATRSIVWQVRTEHYEKHFVLNIKQFVSVR